MTLRTVERPGHRCTTRHAQAIYPFVNADGLGGRGVFVGRDSTGGAFCFDPWVLYAESVLDDPNAIVLGKLGQGKSALVKTLLWRMLLFGRRAFVLDVKREYGPLCRAVGVRPISLVPGGSVRLNPLASRPEEHAQLELLRAVTVTALGGPLTQLEAGGLREALRVVRARGSGEPTLPAIAEVLFAPVAEMAQRLQTTPDALAGDARRAALALQDLCEGPLRGMFDGPTTPGLALDAQLLVLDLHAVRDSPAVGILMACATAWISALLAQTAERPGRERLINVADESWKVAEHSTERYAGERVLKRAIGYVRVSSVGGRSGPGYHTLEIQRASIERTARFHQHELVEILTDEDRSGKTRNRPQFQVAMERLLAGDADAIVVWKVSRFSRNWREAAEDVETLLDHGKDLLSEEGFDTATAGGRLLLRILFSLANWEHDVLGEHWEVIKSKAVRDRGSHLGPAPLGYRHGLDGGVLEPDPETAPLVVEMFERRAAGAPLSELVDMYDTAVPRSSGPRWRQDAERIISNRVYLGETRWRDEVRTDAHHALIGEDLWERANRMFAFEPPRRFKRPKSREFPLTGWLRCSGCGRTMGGSVFRGRHDNPIPTYCCNGRRRGCEHPQMVSAIAAEDWALGEAASMYSSLRVAADGQHDRELSDAVERVAEVAGALHDLASIEMRRSLGDDWLPMIQRLRADKTAAEHHADDVRRRSGVLLGRSLSWEDMDEADQWSALRRMAPAGAVVGPVVGYRDPVARLSFIVDEDELDTVPDLQEAQ